jgi:hypothetical protein
LYGDLSKTDTEWKKEQRIRVTLNQINTDALVEKRQTNKEKWPHELSLMETQCTSSIVLTSTDRCLDKPTP